MRAIRKHIVDVAAILGLIVVALAVSSVILANQRLSLPGWMPVLGQDFTEIEAELVTAQAVTPGQGQTVNVAGVEVGEISQVRLEDGKAIVTLRLEADSVPVYADASVLLRPKSGLKDMVAELTPGTAAAGELADGGRIPIGQTLPDVNLDEILAVLDGDTRDYLQLLLSDGARGLDGNGRELANTIRRFEPLARDTRALTEGLAQRRANIKRAVHNFSLVVDELGGADDQLADFVENSNAVFAALANQDANLRATLRELPSALTATRTALGKTQGLADELGPTLQALRPGGSCARAFACPDAAVPARDDARDPRRDPAVRARRAPARQRASTRHARPRGAHARPAAELQGAQRAAQRLGLQPARRHGGGLPLLGRLGQPPRAGAVLEPGRAGAAAPRAGRDRLPEPAGAGEHRAGQPAARRAHAAARGARSRGRVCHDRPGHDRGRDPVVVKSAPSLGRIAVMAGFALSCFALVLFLWLAFGGPVPLKPKGYRVSVSFIEASQLATEADVRISGVPVGKVRAIEPDAATGRSVVTIELDAEYSPLPSDARALLRQKTLLGETYVELTPGTEGAERLPEGGRLPEGSVSETVELDEILRTFDPATRAAFQEWMQAQAQAIGGHGRDLNDALGNLGPFAEDAAELVDVLNRQEPAVQRLIADTGVVFEALSERNGQLRELIENSNRVFATTASRDRELQEAFVALPTFERESRRTIERLARFARDTDPLVDQLRPAARELSPVLTDLSALAPDLKAFFRESNPLIDASEAGFPAAERVLEDLRPLLAQVDPALRQLNPVLEYLGFFRRDLTAFFANTVAATQASTVSRTGPLHYLRSTNPFNPENLAVYPRRLPTNRPNPYTLPGHFDQLRSGLPAYETRHCGRGGFPTIVNTPQPIAAADPLPTLSLPVPVPPAAPDVENVTGGTYKLPDSLFADILRFAFPPVRRPRPRRRRARSRRRSTSPASGRSIPA